MIKLKRAYDPPAKEDGFRVLVDRVWPRGVKKETLALDLWLKEIAPSTELRQWFAHDPGKWEEFKQRYTTELEEKKEQIRLLKQEIMKEDVTLVYAAKDAAHNNALVLQEFLKG